MILAATGHRPGRLWPYNGRGVNFAAYHPEKELRLLAFAETCLRELEPDLVISGMAQGWDMAVAGAAERLKIPFVACLPFKGQENTWRTRAQIEYHRLLKVACEVEVVSSYRLNVAYYRRDQRMVDRADEILALYDGTPDTGTGITLRYAEEWAPLKFIHNVWPQWEEYREN